MYIEIFDEILNTKTIRIYAGYVNLSALKYNTNMQISYIVNRILRFRLRK